MLNKLWAAVWSYWLLDGETVVKVKGWRTALIQNRIGSRQTIQVMPLATFYSRFKIRRSTSNLASTRMDSEPKDKD